MSDLRTRVPQLEGETFSDWWRRCWYAGELGPNAYGQSTRIARIRRGKWVFIPPHWRGKTTSPYTIRKRQSKGPRKRRRGPNYPGKDFVVKGDDRLSPAERRQTPVQEMER